MNDFIEENKKMIVLALILVAACILFGIINLFMGGSNSGKTTPEKALKDLGKIYYEELLYPSIMENEDIYKEMIDDYKEEGIKVTLDKIMQTISNMNIDVFFNDEISCGRYSTYIIIYPTGYNKKDYKIETHISC
jgi:hypothetical protein